MDDASSFLDYKPLWSNCVFWAARQLYRYGGYAVMRRGHHGIPFHMLWVPPGAFDDHGQPVSVWSYEPLYPHWRFRNWRWDLLLFFRGRVVEGDDTYLPSRVDVDAATQLFNRAYLPLKLSQEIARARRYDLALSIIRLKIDETIGLVEPKRGIETKKTMLQRIGNIIIEQSRPSDIGVRFGDLEFLIVAPHTGDDGAQIFARRLQAALQSLSPAIEVNCGVSTLLSPPDNADTLINRANTEGHNTPRLLEMGSREVIVTREAIAAEAREN